MLNTYWKQFKSGTDIRGVASEGVAGQEVNLTDEAIEKMAAGFVLWLSQAVEKEPSALTIAVGHDSRISAQRIQDAVTRVLVGAGVRVLDCGLASTPSMFMTTIDLACDGSVQITASHHPFNRNGLKFFTKRRFGRPGHRAILLFAQEGQRRPRAGAMWRRSTTWRTMPSVCAR
ncbi:MAG: hypothetical protein ACLVDB_07745 [Anaeromassilibacillus sp.]